MINLLPSELKQNLHYGRQNTKLMSWITASFIALVGVGFIVIGGYVYMQQSINRYAKQVEQSSRELEVQKVEETSKRLDEISANTKLVVQVLSKEVLFSKLLRQLGASLPANTALTGLLIDKVQGGLQLTASATDFQAATQIQVNLQDPDNKVFEKADINGITCNPENAKSQYPCDITLQALFGKNNQYYYIAPSGAKPSKTQGGAN